MRLPLLPLLFVCFAYSLVAQAAALPATVKHALEAAAIPPDAVAIHVQPLERKRPLLKLNAERPMNPASVMKLVTSFAAFERLGPAYTWPTRVAFTGAILDRTLHGELYLVGGGDPMLTHERLWKLLRLVRGLGIDAIDGDLVLDGGVLRLPPHDPGAFDGRTLRPYNSGPYGLLTHFNTQRLILLPGTGPGTPVQAIAEPPLDGLVLDNRIRTAAGNCGVWYRDLDAALESDTAGLRLVLSGSLPGSCGRRDWSAAPLPPAAFGAALVGALWREVGGSLNGQVRSGTAPPNTTPLLEEQSPPLADVVREMNKWSSNVIARQLLATLGMPSGAEDMGAVGALVAHAQLAEAGIDTAGLVIENGAGLSRIERIRADSLAQLLVTAWQRPWMPEFVSALSVAGVDGTARKRLAGSPASGRAHLKTGTLDGVRAMAGYVLDREGQRHAVVMIVNHPNAAASQAAQDALIEWVWSAP